MLKTISSITNAIGALNYKGTWNAATNTPTLADGTGAKGDYYVVSTAGTQTFGGVQLFFGLGDWIAYNGAVWQRVEGGSDGNFANVTLTSTDAGATASPLLELYRDSASPAASDTLGEIEFNGEDSAGNKQAYALFHGSILSPTSGSEQGQLHFETATAGALTEKMIIGTTNLVINEIGAVFNVRIEGDGDANLFYTDATNDRIGIGTATPSVKFNVVGGTAIIDQSSVSGSTLTLNRSSSAGSLAFQFNGTEAGQIAAVSGGGLDFYRGSSPVLAMNISSSSIVTMSAYGAGTATFSAAGVISSVSDETWKTKDGAPTNVDAMIQKLEPGYWYYNNEKKDTFGADRQLGFYAQNVHEAIGEEAAPTPEKYKDEHGNDTDVSKPWGYYDRSVLAVTVMSLKNALTTIEELKVRLTALENK